MLLSPSSFKTRFPVSKSCATGFLAGVDVLEDQMMLPLRLRRTRSPWFVSRTTPDESLSGVSLLATQTAVWTDILPYHIPKYRFLDFPGLKNPNS